MMIKHLTVNHLHVVIQGETIISDLSFEVHAGERFAIIGPNGAGKSTLLKSLLGLVHYQRGKVTIESGKQRAIIGYVPQSRVIDEEMPISARDFISLGQVHGLLPWLSGRERQVLREVMAFTDTDRFARKPIGKLSGGERQRVFLAQALVQHPDLLLLDESTANLDPEAQKQMMQLVNRVSEQWKVTVLFISHDLHLVRQFANQVLLMSRGFYRTGETDHILGDEKMLRHVYRSIAADSGLPAAQGKVVSTT
jgi:ABC-type Mn2+/Zn2+ transport system ATPase subunit